MEISFIIPAHNEVDNLEKLIDEINNFFKNKYIFEIIIVDDNSIDYTGLVADRLSKKYPAINVIHRVDGEKNFGLSLKQGTKKAKGKFIIWLMADRCDNLNSIDKIINKLRMNYDLVIASRYIKGGSRGSLSIRRAILSRGYSLICRVVFSKMRINDATNAYRGFKRKILNEIILESRGFSISAEFSIKAYLYGLKSVEVPTLHLGRETKRSINDTLKLGWTYLRLFKYRFK